jgi:hypothetical protein
MNQAITTLTRAGKVDVCSSRVIRVVIRCFSLLAVVIPDAGQFIRLLGMVFNDDDGGAISGAVPNVEPTHVNRGTGIED